MPALFIGLLVATGAEAAGVEIRLDTEAARAVLAAAQDPALTRAEALSIAHLPGNQGLVRKGRSYGEDSDEARLADAIFAAAHHEPAPAGDRYGFDKVRDDAPAIAKALAELTAPDADTLGQVNQRLGLFVPPRVHGAVTGYLIVGGHAGGFAFGGPKFYLNLALFPSATVARVIIAHELYHAERGLAAPGLMARDRIDRCAREVHAAMDLAALLEDLADEGIASYVGDMLAQPKDGDPVGAVQRDHLELNVQRVSRSATLL